MPWDHVFIVHLFISTNLAHVAHSPELGLADLSHPANQALGEKQASGPGASHMELP